MPLQIRKILLKKNSENPKNQSLKVLTKNLSLKVLIINGLNNKFSELKALIKDTKQTSWL